MAGAANVGAVTSTQPAPLSMPVDDWPGWLDAQLAERLERVRSTLDTIEPLVHLVLGGRLYSRIQRGEDPQTFVGEIRILVLPVQLAAGRGRAGPFATE